MKIIITHKETGVNVATLSVDNNDKVSFVDPVDQNFKSFLENAIRQGIPRLQEIADPENEKRRFIVETREPASAEYFVPILEDFLEKEGYGVHVSNPEEEEEIRKLLETLPDNNVDKKDILARLPSMSRLERTFILKALKDSF